MRICLLIFWCFLGLLASVQSASAHPEPSPASTAVIESHENTQLAVTVYPNDLAMVTEVRTIDVPAGASEIRFHGVSDMIVPETAILQSFEGLRLEGNFNSDLITKSSLLQKSVGRILTIRRMNPVTGRLEFIDAELVSAAPSKQGIQGAVFKTKDGLEALYCSGLAEAVLFSNIPEGLNPIPVLSMKVSSKDAGSKEITLTYLTRGLSWEADYRLDVKDEDPEATLLGWLSLSNNTSKSFKDAGLAVVAGKINRAPQTYQTNSGLSATGFLPTCGDNIRRISNDEIIVTARRHLGRVEHVVVQEASTELLTMPDGSVRERAMPAMTKQVSVRQATREELGDYKLYRAPQTVTLSAHQTKQIAFLLKSDVEFERLHKQTIHAKKYFKTLPAPHEPDFRPMPAPKPMRVEYEIDNDKGGNLAQPLPRGTVRVMSETADGRSLFIGEDDVENLAVDLPFDVEIAESFLVTTSFDYQRVYKDDSQYIKLITSVLNATETPITAEIDFSWLRPSNIKRSSVELDPKDAQPTYRFQVPAESEERLILEIPLKAQVFFVHERSSESYYKYLRNSEGILKYGRGFNGIKFLLNDGRDIDTLSVKGYNPKYDIIRLTVEEISQRVTPSKAIERVETFTFENVTPSPVDIRLEMGKDNDHGPIKLIESSIEPTEEGTDILKITVPGHSEKILTTTTHVLE